MMTESNSSSSCSFKKFICYTLLFTFHFQTLWPSVCFANRVYEQEWQQHKGIKIQIDQLDAQGEHNPILHLRVSLPSSFQRSAKDFKDVPFEETIALKDLQSGKAFYKDLSRSETLLWSQKGLSLFSDWQGNLILKGEEGCLFDQDIALETLGRITLSGSLRLRKLLLKADNVITHKLQGDFQALSVHTLTPQSTFSVDVSSTVSVHNLDLYQGRLHNFGHLLIKQGGALKAASQQVVNYRSLNLGADSKLQVKSLHNNVLKSKTGQVIQGQINGQGTTTFDIEDIDNSGTIEAAVIRGHIGNLLNKADFKVTDHWDGLSIATLQNQGILSGKGQLSVAGTNKGIITGSQVTLNLQGDLNNNGIVSATEKLSTTGTGTLTQQGRLNSPIIHLNNAAWDNYTPLDLADSSLTVDDQVQRWTNHSEAHITVKNLNLLPAVSLLASSSTTAFVNEAVLVIDQFENNRAFTNEGTLKLKSWQQKSSHFINAQDSVIEVTDQTIFNQNQLRNEGTLKFLGPVTGEVDTFQQNKNLTTHQDFAVKGRSFISGKDTTINAQHPLSLTVSQPLVVQGQWLGDKNFNFTALSIEVQGILNSQAGDSVFDTNLITNNRGKVHLPSLTYKGHKLINNEGRVMIGKLNRPSYPSLYLENIGGLYESLKTDDNKTLMHIKGGGWIELQNNNATLVLDEGNYGIWNPINNVGGNLEIDGLMLGCYRGDILTFEGTTAIKSLHENLKSSQTHRFKEIINKGKTRLERGDLSAKKLTNESLSELSLSDGTYTMAEVTNSGLINALPGMQLHTQNFVNWDTVESQTNLTLNGLTAEEMAQNKHNTTTPSINVTIKAPTIGKTKGCKIDPHKIEKDIEGLIPGKLHAKKVLRGHFSDSVHLALALDRFKDKWHGGELISLKSKYFLAHKDLRIPHKVRLEAEEYVNDKYKLSFHALELLADRFKHGKSNGEMAYLETIAPSASYNPLDHYLRIIAQQDLNCQYGQLFGTGPSLLQSIHGNVHIGAAAILPNQPVCSTYTTGTGTVYGYKDFYKKNGSFVATNDELSIKGQNIVLNYCDVQSQKKARFEATDSIRVEGSEIFWKRGGTVKASAFILTRAQAVEHNFSWQVRHRNCYHAGFPSDGSVLTSQGPLTFKTHSNQIQSSNLYCLDNVSVNGLLSNQAELFSLQTLSGRAGCDCCGWRQNYAPTPQFIAGKKIEVNVKVHSSSGYLSGQTFTLKGSSMAMHYIGKILQAFNAMQTKGMIFSTLPIARSMVTNGGLIQETPADIGYSVPLSQQPFVSNHHIPLKGQQGLGLPPHISHGLSFNIQMDALIQVIAQTRGSLFIHDSPDNILLNLLNKGQRYARNGDLLSLERLLQLDESFIYFDIEAMADPNQLKAIPQFYLSAKDQDSNTGASATNKSGLIDVNLDQDFNSTGGLLKATEPGQRDDPALKVTAPTINLNNAKVTQTTFNGDTERQEEKIARQAELNSAGYGSVLATQGDFTATGIGVDFKKGGQIGSVNGNTSLNQDHLTTTETTKSTSKSGGFFGSKTTTTSISSSTKSVPNRIEKSEEGIKIIAGVGKTLKVGHTISLSDTTLQALNGVIQLPLGVEQSSSTSTTTSSSAWQNRVAQERRFDQTYQASSFKSLTVNAAQIDIQQVRGQSLDWVKQIIVENGVINLTNLDEIHLHDRQVKKSLGVGVAAVIALGMGALTCGTGAAAWAGTTAVSATGVTAGTTAASIISTMGAAAFTAVASQAAVALANHDGNIGKAATHLTKSDSLKAIAISTASAGITRGLAQQFNIKFVPGTANTVSEHFQKEALRQSVSASLRMAMGSDSKAVLEQAIRGTLAGVAGGLMANQISAMKQDGEISAATHKLLHGLAGTAGGAILNQGDTLADSMMAGAIGAMTAEIVAEAIGDTKTLIAQRVEAKALEQGIDLDDQDALNPLIVDEMAKTISISTLGAGLAALFTNTDVDTAAQTGTTAVENNFFKVLEKVGKLLCNAGSKIGTQGAKTAVKEEAKQIGKQAGKKIIKEIDNLPKETKRLIGETNKFKKQVFEREGKPKSATSLRAAQKELKGEQIPLAQQKGKIYDHKTKVQDAQKGLKNLIDNINMRLSHPKVMAAERTILQQELSKASKLWDYTKAFVPKGIK